MLGLVELGWGQDNPAFRQMFTSFLIPGGTPEQMRALNELERASTTPECAARILASVHEYDASEYAPRVTCPTLVLHARGDVRAPYEEGRRLATLVAGARFVTLETNNHILLEQEPAFAQFFAEIREFLAAREAPRRRVSRPHAARARDSRAGRARARQQRHRRTPRALREDGAQPHHADLRQAPRPDARAGDRACARGRVRSLAARRRPLTGTAVPCFYRSTGTASRARDRGLRTPRTRRLQMRRERRPLANQEETMDRFLAALFAIAAILLAGRQSLPPGPPVTKQVTVNGVTMKYVEQGRGEVVLFIPGGMSDLRAFESSREAGARSYRYVSPTLRYFGPDPWPDNGRNFSMATHVNDLAAFIRALNAGPVNIVGWSYSGSLGILLAIQHPELVRSLFVYEQSNLASWVTDPAEINASAASRKATFGPAVVASKGGDQAGAVRIIMNGVNGGPGAFDVLPASTRAMHLENARAVPLFFAAPPPPPVSCGQLGALKIPVAMGVGELSPVFFQAPAKAAARCISGSTLIVVPNGRHHWPVTAPADFTETLLAFLKRT
jgi:pimeloyl-ACP methyl ester carboxylesterase